MKNFLFIVEGEVTEKVILKEVLQKLNINVVDNGTIPLNYDNKNYEFDISKLENDKINVIIVQGPRTRIHDLLTIFERNNFDLDLWLLKTKGSFSGIFWIYDVDHTGNKELEIMFDGHKDEITSGMLLVSSPCIEVIADIDRNETLNCNHLSEYKRALNVKFNSEGESNTREYIIKNFFKLIMHYLQKNRNDSGLTNIMEHPQYVINKVNKHNRREFIDKDNQPVSYNYFTTVIYCAIAYVFGLTKQIDNYDIVLDFFKQHQ